ncbi:FecR family protein [Cellulophaga baltica 4]|uniref:FecR family protein n=1 Tax=Cellulophaga baltica TaxID=76594 RepID=UPI000407118A|nr:FecR family protein [Cellulophaga baltica]WFO15186.1 FecR family protein [Cellulophaga baltica 4]
MDKNKLIQKWLADELTEEENNVFATLDEAPFYTKIIEDATVFKASNFSKMPDFETFKARIEEDKTPVKKLQWFTPMLKIASAVVILFGVYYSFFYTTLTDIETSVAQKTTIELPDSSRVVLNASSEVKYNANEWDDKREIELNGEAFFDVAKGSKFDVITPSGTVSVLGTEFNVKQRAGIFEVTCYEGTVRVVTETGTEILKVGDKFLEINKTIKTSKHTVPSPQWVDNMSQFERIPVYEVLAELERQYAIQISAQDIDTEQLFTGGFVHNNLEDALMAIAEPLGLTYEILKQNKVRLLISE